MVLTFIGAARQVTGSCFILQTEDSTVLIDCGMAQGKDDERGTCVDNLPIPIAIIDAVVLTHAHIDHSGMLPLLVKRGYAGPVYCTAPTANLCSIMLPDSGHIQEMEIEWKNRKRLRAGQSPIDPVYNAQDALACLKNFKPCPYDTHREVTPDIRIRFAEAGHLLGSASVEVWVTEDGATEKVVFSGDIGAANHPLIKDPAIIDRADYVVMESTYGDRDRQDPLSRKEVLAEYIRHTLRMQGNLVIPSFAVGRTQELLYEINQLLVSGQAPGLEDMPVYLDSPLAIQATQIFQKDYLQYYDQEALAYIDKYGDPLASPNLIYAQTADESKAINADQRPKIIISSSGMCEAGRVKHHLKHNLWREDSTILFVGYQAEGTLGRIISDGASKVRIFGEDIQVKARIAKISGFSSHADHRELLGWVNMFHTPPSKVFVVHGSEQAALHFAAELTQQGQDAIAPGQGWAYDTLTKETNAEYAVFAQPEPQHAHPEAPQRLRAVSKHVTGLLNQAQALLEQQPSGAQAGKVQDLQADLEALWRKWQGVLKHNTAK
ncbi:MBL fold hydrolase [Bacteroidia bacterium]|nr:MBL fold hydrolase [Bacteroidia bacterium]